VAETLTASEPRASPVLGYAVAFGLTALATVGGILVEQTVAIPNLSLIFVLPVVIAAVAYGWGPSVFAAVGGTLCFNFFLIEPRYTLAVEDPANVWALVWLLGVAGIVSWVAAEGRRRTLEALEAAGQAEALQALARALVAAPDQAAILNAAAEALGRLFRADAAVLVTAQSGGLEVGAATAGADLSPKDLEAAEWALAARLATRADAYPVEGGRFDFWPIVTPTRVEALLGVALGGARGRPANPERLIGIVSGYLAVALERERYARPILAARVRAAGDQIKADLLAAVSHDLKTPLSTILFTLQSLQRFDRSHDEAARAELLAVAEAETARLSGLVGNLLEMSRIEANAVPVRLAPAQVRTLVAVALERAGQALAGRTIENATAGFDQSVMIDLTLAETALANVLENAAKYSPAGAVISVTASKQGHWAVLEVLDEGPGFPEPVEPLFEKFARGVTGDGRAPGTGLGLAVARSFLEAQGARIEAENRLERSGGRVRILLPLAATVEAAS